MVSARFILVVDSLWQENWQKNSIFNVLLFCQSFMRCRGDLFGILTAPSCSPGWKIQEVFDLHHPFYGVPQYSTQLLVCLCYDATEAAMRDSLVLPDFCCWGSLDSILLMPWPPPKDFLLPRQEMELHINLECPWCPLSGIHFSFGPWICWTHQHFQRHYDQYPI